ncbi:sperm flagellar protein 2-like isoform X3 [Littorina saxatilis]|uniref:sperm flagellar protein 2-like isoform X3 n=1 Tax=Littorina saxatilis TaxID=31220 RepID=UPI0038B51416
MTDILCRWLNTELNVAQKVDQSSFAREFSSGYLIGEVLHKYQLQDDFDQFSQSRTADSKLNNFTRLEPTLHLLGIPFDTNLAHDVMTEKHGIATRLMYQMYIALNNKKKANLTGVAMETQRPAAPAKLNAIESGIYKENSGDGERLKHVTPRQTDLNLEQVASRFHEHQIRMEQTAFRERFLESENRLKQQQEQRHVLLERSRLLHAKQSEMVAKIKAATVHIPKPPAHQKKTAQELKIMRRKREADETIDSISKFEDKLKMMLLPPTDDGGDELDVSYILKRDEDRGDTVNLIKVSSNDEYICKIRKRLQEDGAAREEREKRRRKVLGEQMSAHQSQEEARREEMMVNRLMRQSQQERRIAVQLLQARHEKEVIRNNRIMREQQYQERRLKDFEDALNRESVLARLHKEEYREEIEAEQERHATIAAQRAEEQYRREYDSCYDIVCQIVDFSCKVAEYRQLTENLLPPKLMRDWTALFVSGCPLFETELVDTGEPTPEQILEEERQMLLDEGDFMEYKNMIGEWQPPEVVEIAAPPRSNPVVGHIIHRLYNIVHPPTPPPPPPEFPPFPIRACVVGKVFSGKTTAVRKLADDHRLVVLDAGQLVTEAVEAHRKNEVEEIPPEPEVVETEPEPAASQGEAAPGQPPMEGQVPVEMTTATAADGVGAGADLATVQEAVSPDRATALKTVADSSSASKLRRDSAGSKPSSVQRSRDKLKDPNEPQPSLRNKLGSKALKFLKKGRPVDDQIVVDILADAIKRIPEGTGWVIDGYPQNYNQAKLLEKALSGYDANAKDNSKIIPKSKARMSSLVPDPRPPPPPAEPVSGIDVVIVFDVEDELCLKRASGRTFTIQGEEKYHEEFKPPPEGSATGIGKQEKVIPVSDPGNDQEQIQHRITTFHDSWPKLEKWFTRFGTLKRVDAMDNQEAVFLEVEKILEDTVAKIQGKDVESSVPLESTEETQKPEEVPETAPGAPPETEPETSKEVTAPGGPEDKTSRPGSKGSPRASGKSRSSSKEGKKDGKRDKSGSPKREGSGKKSEGKRSSRVTIDEPEKPEKAGKKGKKGKKDGDGSSPKSQKGHKGSSKKGKTPEPEPDLEPEEPTGPPPPQPGDEEWDFVDLNVEPPLAEVLSTQWDGVEKAYVSNCKHVFRNVRHERENIYRYYYQIRKDFLSYLRRPDHKQEFVDQWQKDYNAVPDDMREDEETRGELHQRVDDLRERLWNICDERKEQAERERETIMNDGWLDDRLGVLSNHYITTMQSELDRYQDTVRLLKDYYKGMDGQIPDALNINYERIPLIELPVERPETPEKAESETAAVSISDDHPGTAKSDRSKSPKGKSPKDKDKDRSKSPKDRGKSPKDRGKSPKEEKGGRKSQTPSAKGKRNRSKDKDSPAEESPPSDGAGLRIKIPLVPRRPVSPDPDTKPGTTPGKEKKDKKKDKKGAADEVPGFESPMPPQDPDEKLLFDAHWFATSAIVQMMSQEMAAKEAEEEAKRMRDLEKDNEKNKGKPGKKGGKKGGKSRSPSPKKGKKDTDSTVAATPPLEDLSEEEKLKKLTRERMREEYYFAIKEEETASKIRLDLIKAIAMAVLQDLKIKADSAFKDMNDWLGARFLKEMESIDTMSEVMRHAIEEARRLKEQVILQQEDFLVDSDHHVLKSPSPPPAPEMVEAVMSEHFTVNQLYNLYQQFSSIAPSGIMSTKSFVETLENIVSVSHGMEQLPDSWMHITPGQIHEISNALATETDYVDWRRLLLALTWPVPVPTQAQLLDTLQRFKEMDQKDTGYVTREQYDRMDLWFKTGDNSSDSYDRKTSLKKILFDIFADHREFPSKLNYLSMLMYFSAVPNSHEGFLRALSVVSNTHMPRLQKPLPGTAAPEERVTSTVDSINLEANEEEREDKAAVEPSMTADKIPPEAVDAVVPLDSLYRVFHHSEIASGDSHRFSVSVDPEDATSKEKLSVVYVELGDESLKPVLYRVLIEHPLIQDIVVACKSFKALDLKGILSSSTDHAELNSLKTMD